MRRLSTNRRLWADGLRGLMPNPLTRVDLPPSQTPSQPPSQRQPAPAPAPSSGKPGGR